MIKRIPKKNFNKVIQLDLLSYFKNYAPEELVRNGRNDSYYLRSHDSLKISNGKWYQWSTHKGGKSALDYLTKVEKWKFEDALHYLNDLIQNHPPVMEIPNSRQKVHFRLPEENISNDEIIDYLVHQRKLDFELIVSLIEAGFIYEEARSHNVVFVGYDSNNVARFACKRATNSAWKQDCLGSNKEYSFNISNFENTELHIFESAIDLLSYITLLLMDNNTAFYKFNYLSLSGVGERKQLIPASLSNYMMRYPNIKKLVLHLDNDKAGQSSSEAIIKSCSNKYEVINEPPKVGKDINEELVNMKNI